MSVRAVPHHERIKNDLRSGSFELTQHALKRMRERGVRRTDIINLGFNLFRSLDQENGKVKLEGLDCDGEELTVVCVYDLGTLVITVY